MEITQNRLLCTVALVQVVVIEELCESCYLTSTLATRKSPINNKNPLDASSFISTITRSAKDRFVTYQAQQRETGRDRVLALKGRSSPVPEKHHITTRWHELCRSSRKAMIAHVVYLVSLQDTTLMKLFSSCDWENSTYFSTTTGTFRSIDKALSYRAIVTHNIACTLGKNG